jgi:bromodomain adjacent to zinc finger domain protein 1A
LGGEGGSSYQKAKERRWINFLLSCIGNNLNWLPAEAAAAAAEKAAKVEAERLEAEKKKKKKPLRYPTEDLDVKLSDRDLKAGAKLVRPMPNRSALPFGDNQEVFEAFLMSWNFLVSYGYDRVYLLTTLSDWKL